MKTLLRGRWLLVLAMAAAVAGGTWQARAWLLAGVRARLTRQYQQQVTAFPEREAVRLIRGLAQGDDEWLDVLVAASADERFAVAVAAETELRELVDRWAALPPEDCSTSVAKLADLLARQAPQLSAERRHLAHALAQRLIEWPVDGRRADAGKLIADCEAVLLLPRADAPEIRVAAAPAAPSTEPLPASPPPTAAPEPPVADIRSPPATDPLPTINQPAPEEPRRFNAPRPLRISDD